jgi:ketosteroid isomerase-like protein
MANEKVEMARKNFERFMETQRATEVFSPDLVWDFSEFRGWVEDDVYLGPAGFDEQMARWTEPFEDYTIELTDVIDLGGDDLLALGVQRGRLKGSGAVLEMPLGQIWTFPDGKLTRIRIFADQDDARAAAGVAR